MTGDCSEQALVFSTTACRLNLETSQARQADKEWRRELNIVAFGHNSSRNLTAATSTPHYYKTSNVPTKLATV
eukprot:882025-Amphidinium_carterae.1